MPEIKERINTLEHALGSFIIQTEKAINSISAEVKTLSKEMREFKSEMKGFKDEMLDFKDEMREFKDEMKEFKDEMKGFKDQMGEFKEEMREFKDEMKGFKDEIREENKRMNKRWGEISNKLGSIAEDIATPGLLGIIREHFNEDPDKRMDTMYIRNSKARDNIREFDAIALTDRYFFLCEIKTTPRHDYVKEFIDLVTSDKIYEYFPEYQDKVLVPVFSSFELPENVIKNLTKHQILAMAMGDDHMEVVNKEVLKKWVP